MLCRGVIELNPEILSLPVPVHGILRVCREAAAAARCRIELLSVLERPGSVTVDLGQIDLLRDAALVMGLSVSNDLPEAVIAG